MNLVSAVEVEHFVAGGRVVEWFVARDGQSFGPFEFQILVDAAQRGELQQDDFVWQPGMDDWCHASAVGELWKPVQPMASTDGEVGASPNRSRLRRVPIGLKHLLLPWGRTNRRSFWGLLIAVYFAGMTGLRVVYV